MLRTFILTSLAFFKGLFGRKNYTVEKKKYLSELDYVSPWKPRSNAHSNMLAFHKRVKRRRKANKVARKMRKLNYA